ncbi:hypothetical protein XENOCAPTIV_014828, partial [Xenoophorus captivus]
KRNVLELEIRQDYTSSGTQKYGPIKVTVQELDGSFNHTLQIEENSLKHDIPCHSKSRSADSPLLWIRIDPDMSILRKVEFEQADFMWQYQLRYERDVVAQLKMTSCVCDLWPHISALTSIPWYPAGASTGLLTSSNLMYCLLCGPVLTTKIIMHRKPIVAQLPAFFIYDFCGTHVFHKVKYFLISAFILSVSRFCPQLSAGSGTTSCFAVIQQVKHSGQPSSAQQDQLNA